MGNSLLEKNNRKQNLAEDCSIFFNNMVLEFDLIKILILQ